MSIDRLAAKVAAVPLNGRGQRRYPDSLKRELMAALATSGLTHKDFAAKVGVPNANLCHWRDLAPKKAPRLATSSFKALAVEPEPASPGIVLRAPGGIVLEGISIAAAAELIAAVSARSSC